MHSKQQGVTLIELMITVAIVAILAAIAYPSYRNQIMRSHRSEAKAALLQVQVAQEKYFLQNNSYGTLAQLGPASLGLTATGYTANGYYLVTITPATPTTTYAASAAAAGSQSGDTACSPYGITETGNKSPSTGGCW